MTSCCRTYCFLLWIFFSPLGIAQNKPLVYETTDMKMVINGKGYLEGFYDKSDNINYLAPGKTVSLLSIRCNGDIESPSSMKVNGNDLILFFGKNKVEAEVKVTNRKSCC